MATVEKTIPLTLDPTIPCFLTVIIGQGQKGRIAFRKPSGEKVNAETVNNEPIGTGQELTAAGVMHISAMATDVQQNTNQTSVLLRMNDQEIGYFEKEAGQNGTVFYDITLDFQP